MKNKRKWKLADEIKRSKLTYKQIAERAGIGRSTIDKLARGEREVEKVRIETAMRISGVLGFDWRYFYTDEPENLMGMSTSYQEPKKLSS